jgi:hypothetical protein
VLLLDDLGDVAAETELILSVLSEHEAHLAGGAFLRAGAGRIRESRGEARES